MSDEFRPDEFFSDDDKYTETIPEDRQRKPEDRRSAEVILPRYGYYRTAPGAQRQTVRRKTGDRHSMGQKIAMTVFLAVIFGTIAGLVMRGIMMVGNGNTGTASTAESHTIGRTDPVVQEEPASVETVSADAQETYTSATGKGAVADVAAACMPSVVAITTVSIQEIPTFFGYGSREYRSASSGSGIIVGENEQELLIATNNHVVSGAQTLSVLFIGDDENEESGLQNIMSSIAEDLNYDGAVSATVKGTDAANDLAVIAVKKTDIPADTMARIKIAALGDSDELVVGEQVVAIGNALGYGQSVTSGWVSALNRSFESADESVSDLIQTDAAINPGNSGGALLNMKGEVVGINSVKYADSSVEGMGYAIPITKASPILSKLMMRETREKVDSSEAAYLGVSVADMSREASRMYGIPTGAFVAEAFEGGAAAAAGIREGDIIIELDGTAVTDRDTLIELLSYYRAGEQVDIVIARKDAVGVYEDQLLTVTMGSR